MGKLVAQIVESPGELTLKILRQDGMGDGPGDDRKMLGPLARWLDAVVGCLKSGKPCSQLVAARRSNRLPPARRTLFKRWPELAAVVVIAHFGCIDDPEEPMPTDFPS